ncbi:membrane protein involved in the export of O-antigen and teichoic acid [Rivularia sp. PCC 7116]|uniref:oligosaccharide flippase family protein n=1 Tax=Rivularia sp. PCC 7116 TaxID=373994 RepID=UPI00029F4A72|nr:oligosaccharide flippase family protein [Rivularia sp. PCC 7116]AFY55939.1 membrane protein involved in the export of O-antigen and teichoic acid [Rivularia sp. PCC 7116]
MTSLKQRAIRGAIWTTAGFGGKYILRFGNNLVLTRLLQPEFFGLMALVTTFRMGLELFSDIGISQNIVNSKQGDDRDFLNTAWTLQAIRGVIIWLICVVFITFPASYFYNDKRLLMLIPISVLYSVFEGFSSTSIHTLHRRMELGKLSIYELALQVVFFATLIILVYFYPTIWSLAIGNALAGVYKLVSSFWLIPGYVNRFAWNKEAVKEILSFGKWMFAASGLMFAAEQSDRLVLAKLLSFKLLGIYTVAYTLASIPKEVIRQLSHKVIFPTISKQRDLPRKILRGKILKQRRLILLGCGVILAALVTVGDLIIGLLYDQRYIEATWMMPILCCGMWFSLLFYTISPALLAIGKPLYSAQSNFARFAIIILAVPTANQIFGVIGAIGVIAFSDLPLYIVNLYGLWHEKLFCFAQDLQTTAFFIGILTLFIFIRYSLGLGFPIDQLI